MKREKPINFQLKPANMVKECATILRKCILCSNNKIGNEAHIIFESVYFVN